MTDYLRTGLGGPMMEPTGKVKRLEAEIGRLRAALEFYAHASNYVPPSWNTDATQPVIMDGGDIARQALTRETS